MLLRRELNVVDDAKFAVFGCLPAAGVRGIMITLAMLLVWFC